uniref:Plac8 onzin related protein 2 n=1 Tax=Oncorhynchus tshawytscha TaxID=74940 RepID=A0A8C8CCP2_ONCTS
DITSCQIFLHSSTALIQKILCQTSVQLDVINGSVSKLSLTGCFGFWCCPCHACIHTREYGQCLCLPLLDIFGIIPPVTMSMRVSMRQRYGIKGTICNDCVNATCCNCCVWCQMSREMKSRIIPIVLVSARK